MQAAHIISLRGPCMLAGGGPPSSVGLMLMHKTMQGRLNNVLLVASTARAPCSVRINEAMVSQHASKEV